MIEYVSQGYFNHRFLLSHSSVLQFVSVPVFIRGPILFFSTSPDFKLQASELVWHTVCKLHLPVPVCSVSEGY